MLEQYRRSGSLKSMPSFDWYYLDTNIILFRNYLNLSDMGGELSERQGVLFHLCIPPAVAMVQTKVKPILLSGEFYMGN